MRCHQGQGRSLLADREDFYACGPDESEYFAHTVNTANPIWTVHVINDSGANETLVQVQEAFR